MPMIDVLQEFGRKLKHPQIRQWVHPGTGDDYYYATPGTKSKLTLLARLPRSQTEDYFIAYKGKEYTPKEFLRHFPRFRLKQKITTKDLKQKIRAGQKRGKKRKQKLTREQREEAEYRGIDVRTLIGL